MNDDEFQAEDAVSTEEDELKMGDSFTRYPLLKKRKGKSLSELRHPRQKFCARWELEFPWLKADRVDEALGYCTICHKHLVCKKSHLERHQDSFRHIRMQITNIEAKCEGEGDGDVAEGTSVPEFLECGKETEEEDYVEYDAEFDQEIELDQNFAVEYELNPGRLRREKEMKQPRKPAIAAVVKKRGLPESPAQETMATSSPAKLDRLKLLKQIDRDRNQLSDYLHERRKQHTPATTFARLHPDSTQMMQSGQPLQRDPFDLFFESVSASVKILPPKLAAELKSRVSQIVAEFELRAICERESQGGPAPAVEQANVMVSAGSMKTSEPATEYTL